MADYTFVPAYVEVVLDIFKNFYILQAKRAVFFSFRSSIGSVNSECIQFLMYLYNIASSSYFYPKKLIS